MTRRRRSSIAILFAVVITVVGLTVRTTATDAAWTGRDHLAANVSSAYWPTSGYARAEAGRVTNVDFVVGVVELGSPLPWAGPTAARTQDSPGATTVTAAGPYSTGGVLGLVNQFASSGATGNTIGGTMCANYSWGPGTPTQCASATQRVFAAGSLSSYRIRANLLLGIGAVDVVTVPSALSATASCDLSAPTAVNAAVTTRAANAGTGNQGTLQVRGNTVSLPAANAATNFSFAQGSLLDLSPAVSGTLTSTVTQNGAQARSTLVMNGRVLRLSTLGVALLDIRFTAVLMDVSCGTAASPPAPLSTGLAAARVAAPPVEGEPDITDPESVETPAEDASDTVETSETVTDAPRTDTVETSAPETTTDAEVTQTTTSVPSTTTASSTTATATTTTPTTAVPTTTIPTTTVPSPTADPSTTFSGPTTGEVARFVTADGRSCSAGTDPGAFACDDGTTLTFDPDALSTASVDSAIIDGVWTPVTASGVRVPVISAVRG